MVAKVVFPHCMLYKQIIIISPLPGWPATENTMDSKNPEGPQSRIPNNVFDKPGERQTTANVSVQLLPSLHLAL